MKYKDPVTGEIKSISVKASDTLPIGSIVDFDGDVIPEGWEPFEEVINIEEANTNLDNFIETGVYFFRGSAVTPVNVPAGSNGWLIVLKGHTNDYIKQIWYRLGSEPNHYQTYVRTRLSGVWTAWQRMVAFDDIYYEDGDTYEIGEVYEIVSGFISSGRCNLYVDIKVPKLLTNITKFTVDRFHIRNVRGIAGYILQNQTELELKVTPYLVNDNTIELVISNPDGSEFPNSTNNTPVSVEIIDTKFTFKK